MSWPKKLTVDQRIVVQLSKGTYENFPRSIREIVSNAYDADATIVEIKIDEKARIISIIDNGIGMTPTQFDHFLRIAGKPKDISRRTAYGRKKIGQFGIGFLAMFPYCEVVEIESTIEGQINAFLARIPASEFFSGSSQSAELSETQTRVTGKEFVSRDGKNAHYTRITLKNTNSLVDQYFKQVTEYKRGININEYNGLDRLIFELSDTLLLKFGDDSPLGKIVQRKKPNFAVYLNGSELKAYEPSNSLLDASDVGHNNKSIEGVEFSYAIGTNWKAVRPNQARGLRLRLNGVGVGSRTVLDLQTYGKTYSRLHWLTGQVNIVDGLDDSITIDRDSFADSARWEEVKEFLRARLRFCANKVEGIAVAKKEVSQEIEGSSRSVLGEGEKKYRKAIEKLLDEGFEVSEKGSCDSSLVVDLKQKKVEVPKNSISKIDHISIGEKEFSVSTGTWASSELELPYRWLSSDKLVLNDRYELLVGSHKSVFRKILAILAVSDRNSNTKSELIRMMIQYLEEEF